MNLAPHAEPFVVPETNARIERILCPVDFSEASLKAYRYAQSIAGHYHATFLVQHIIELAQHPCADYAVSVELFDEFSAKLISRGQDELQQFVDTIGGLRPECIVQEAMVADAILSLAQERKISLIVLGTHGRRGFDRMMLGSVTERVLRHASCPVLAVRQTAKDSNKPDATNDSVPIRRILCCVDFSAHSKRASEYALSAAVSYDADVTFLHVLDDISSSADVGKETTAAIENLENLIPLAARNSTKTHAAVRLGKAYQEILQFASEAQSDLIVTGVRGRNAWDLTVFGSTTYRVIQLSPGPVLTIPI